MILYEVNLEIEPSIEDQYLVWLKDHIQKMLQFEGFLDSKTYRQHESHQKVKFTVHYFLKDQESLDHYLENHASQMREDALTLFSGQFSASRRVFRLVSL